MIARALRTSRPGPTGGGGAVARWDGVPNVAELSPYMVLRAVWLSALRLDGVVFQNVAPELLPCILLELLLCSGGLGGDETSPNMFCPRTWGETGPTCFVPEPLF